MEVSTQIEKAVNESHGRTTKGFDEMSITQRGTIEQPKTNGEWALLYASMGWRVFPLIQDGKTPLTKRGYKDATTDMQTITDWWAKWPKANIGFPTGEAFDVLDFDLNLSGQKDGAPHPEIWDQYRASIGGGPIVQTHNGYHAYFVPTGIGNKAQIGPLTGERDEKGKEKRACDWRGKGGYVVAPPSTFAGGVGRYTWLVSPFMVPFGGVPDEVQSWTKPKRTKPAAQPKQIEIPTTTEPSDPQKEAYLKSTVEGMERDMSSAVEGERNHVLFRISARMYELLNGSLGQLPDAGCMESVVYNAALNAGLEDLEISRTMLSAKDKVGSSAAEPEYKANTSSSYISTDNEPRLHVSHEVDESWKERLVRFPDKKDGTPGALMAVDANLDLILTHDPRFAGKIAHNEFSNNVEKLSKLPCETGERKWNPLWGEIDDAELVNWLSHNYGVHFKDMGTLRRGILTASLKRNYHPVRSYLKSLKWDGRERLAEVPSRLFGCEDPEYAGKVFRWWMLSAVYRVMEPGCKADYAIILEGAQGIGKSTILATLGGEWFSDSQIDMTSKDAYSQTIGTWIVEIAELSGFSKTDDTRAKSFFSERAPRVRLPFRRDAEIIPRQCVFAGTTNENDYLKDSTGNRRYWPIKCGVRGSVQLAELAKRRDQLWAEAYEMYKRKERYYPTTDEENAILTDQQSKRTLDDAWSYPIQNWLRTQVSDYVNPADVFANALQKPIGTVTTADSRRLAAILKKLGYESFRRIVDGKKVTMYRLAGASVLPTIDDSEDEIPY